MRSSWGVGTSSAAIFECPKSGLRFRLPPPKDEIEQFYGAEYHNTMTGATEESSRARAYRRENRDRIAMLQGYCPGGRVLDVGCSVGVFASQLAEAGFEAMGSDISAHGCAEARKRLGAENVFEGDIDAVSEKLEGSLDAVTLMDVIEHFEDVVSPLRAIARVLKPNGILFLRTPTLRSPFHAVAELSHKLTAGHYKTGLLKLYHAEHLYFFDEKSIRELLEDTGFDVVTIQSDPLNWDNFRGCELHQGPIANALLATIYFVGRLVGRGHGMKIIARKRTGDHPAS